MNRMQLVSSTSPWLILLCLLIGALYAFLLYQKKAPWPTYWNYILAFFRGAVATIIAMLLLLNPLFRQVENTQEKPTLVLALDNSESLPSGADSASMRVLMENVKNLGQEMEKADMHLEVRTFSGAIPMGELEQVKFDHPSSDLGQLIRGIQNDYENRNLDKIVLISDGIHNQGISPNYQVYGNPVYTMALGDTTPQKDVKLLAVLANKVAYLGNQFPVAAEIENVGYTQGPIRAFLTQNGQILDQKTLTFKEDGEVQEVTFYTKAQQKGMQHYVVQVEIQNAEFSTLNNVRDIYVEVIDGKEKILLVAHNPHPDIKALKTAIEKNENYEFSFFIPGINQLKEDKYDLVIFHQVPNLRNVGNELVDKFKNTARWFILGAQSDLNSFNRSNNGIRVLERIRRMDRVTPVYNQSFNKFTFDAQKVALIERLPPLAVPFADYALSNGSEVLLSQKVGNIPTDKPMLLVNQRNNVKTAVLTGEGIWQWRLEEFALGNSHESFDELISKLIQYLSSKEDKRRLRVYPINTEFYDFEKVVFESEVYNEIYERVYDQKINLTLQDEAGKTYTYPFTSSQGNTRFEISGLKKGVYRYQATAQVQGRSEQSSGQFTVKDLQLESLNSTANHNLLRQISQKTGGSFFQADQFSDLITKLKESRKPDIIHSTETLSEIINFWWIFFLMALLAALEWGLRKYQGSY